MFLNSCYTVLLREVTRKACIYVQQKCGFLFVVFAFVLFLSSEVWLNHRCRMTERIDSVFEAQPDHLSPNQMLAPFAVTQPLSWATGERPLP